tara:strand:+ start:116 stop:637 length:522 start_codon:yes stop_codon:yes gene_type:complete
MLTEKLRGSIKSFPNFPKEGILFRDISPILTNPLLFQELIEKMSSIEDFNYADCIISVDARGFIFGSAIALNLQMPMIMCRKKNKLPGSLLQKSYGLEYGEDTLSIQKELLKPFKKFIIIDDLLASGGTAKCVSDMLLSFDKDVLALVVVVELPLLNGRKKINYPVYSQLEYK